MTIDPLAALRDGILRGVAHALSNRVAALSGVTGLVDFGGLPPDRLSQALGSEVRQLNALAELVRMLPVDSRPRGEAIELQSVLPQIVALHALHGELRDVACALQYDRETPPVHLPRSVLVYSVLILIDAAKRYAALERGSVALSYHGDPACATVVLDSRRGTESPPAVAEVDDLRERIGALVAQVDPSLALRVSPSDGDAPGVRFALDLPTLADVRRRERDGSPSAGPGR